MVVLLVDERIEVGMNLMSQDNFFDEISSKDGVQDQVKFLG